MSNYGRNGNRLERKYSPDQERDERGRFGSGGSSAQAARQSDSTRSAGAHSREARAARAATDKAKLIQRSGTPKQKIAAHLAAARAHDRAADKAPNERAREAHYNAVARHEAQVEYLMDSIGIDTRPDVGAGWDSGY